MLSTVVSALVASEVSVSDVVVFSLSNAEVYCPLFEFVSEGCLGDARNCRALL